MQQLLVDIYRLNEGVALLHDRGLAHGDLKPDNAVSWRNQVWLIDFGSSRLEIIDGNGTTQAQTGGTQGWRAPEICSSDDQDENADSVDYFAVSAACW